MKGIGGWNNIAFRREAEFTEVALKIMGILCMFVGWGKGGSEAREVEDAEVTEIRSFEKMKRF